LKSGLTFSDIHDYQLPFSGNCGVDDLLIVVSLVQTKDPSRSVILQSNNATP